MPFDREGLGVGQGAAKKITGLDQGQSANTEKGKHSEGEQVFHNAPESGNKDEANYKHRVDGHGHRKRHRKRGALTVGLHQGVIRLGLAKRAVGAKVPNQQSNVENGKACDPKHGDEGCDFKRYRAGFKNGQHVAQQGDGSSCMRDPEHQIHEKSNGQTPSPERGQEVEGGVGIGWSVYRHWEYLI